MDVTLSIVVIGAVVVVSLLGAWAVSRYQRDKVDETNAGTRSLEDLKAEDLKARKEKPTGSI
jgi:hypothetical protein